MDTRLQIVAQDGFKPIIGSLVAYILFSLLSFDNMAILSIIVGCFGIYFYRNPERMCNDDSRINVVSPVDGKIKNIIKEENKITLVVSKPICFCGLLRMPFKGQVRKMKKIHGLCNANSVIGERECIEFVHENKVDTMQLVIYPRIFSQVNFYFDDSYQRIANRIGFLLDGRVLITMSNINLKVSIGDMLYAGVSALGSLENEN